MHVCVYMYVRVHARDHEPIANKAEEVERSTGTLTRGTFVIKYLAWVCRLQTIGHLEAGLQLRCNAAMCTGAFTVGVGEGETEGRIPFRDPPALGPQRYHRSG